ncbi:hypothetical protein, partial [Acidocella sp.]|uniref:hypothetical protein n=1 Tax=Acidocella sp. TaxID=50710 RepID=UPI0026162F4C
TYDEIIEACKTAWNWLIANPQRISSIGSRDWAMCYTQSGLVLHPGLPGNHECCRHPARLHAAQRWP